MNTFINRIAAVLGLLILGGCASLPADRLEERQYRNFEYAERFKYDRTRCNARGGRIIVDAIGKPDRHGIPRNRERYICA
ncbi:MAG: hypothetical protein QNJ19_13595 [Woeseiaceae bacterium]|nr:hypothetical protein [Woeseiaceae bacterium]